MSTNPFRSKTLAIVGGASVALCMGLIASGVSAYVARRWRVLGE